VTISLLITEKTLASRGSKVAEETAQVAGATDEEAATRVAGAGDDEPASTNKEVSSLAATTSR
jgi:hypothetical protein